MSIQLDDLVTRLILDSTGFTTGVTNANTQGKNLQTGLGSTFKSIGLGGVASFLTVTGAIAGTVAGLKAVIKSTLEYGDAVRELSMLNGVSAEEASRVIQVADDYKISISELTLASKTLAKEGISLTIDSLKTLADQYNALSTADEKQAFLMANFGARGGTAFVEMMNAGSLAIQGANDAVDDNLVLTQQMLDQQRQLQASTDQLKDAWDGLKVEIGTLLVPGLLSLVNTINAVIGINDAMTQSVWNMLGPIEKLVAFLSMPLWKSVPLIFGGGGGETEGGDRVIQTPGGPAVIPAPNPPPITRLPPGARRFASGGSFTVPPGFGNDSFPMRAQSGEQVSITPAGKPAEMDLSARSLDRLADMLTRAMAKML